MDSLPECVRHNSIHQFSPVLQSKAMGDVEHDISIYWKDQDMEEKAMDWKMLEWLTVSLWIDLIPTALQGDSRLAAAPFTPGALLVSDSNLGDILGPMEKTTQVHRSSRSHPDHWALTHVPEQRYDFRHTHYELQPCDANLWFLVAAV